MSKLYDSRFTLIGQVETLERALGESQTRIMSMQPVFDAAVALVAWDEESDPHQTQLNVLCDALEKAVLEATNE